MKFFLSSEAITPNQYGALEDLVGKSLSLAKIAVCENAADVYVEEKRGFVYDSREALEKTGAFITYFDLREYKQNEVALTEMLQQHDVVWFGGGNIYYLRCLMRESGFDKVVSALLQQGLVYGGESAGAIVIQNSLDYYDSVDKIELAPEPIYTGLELLDIALIPHWGNEKYQQKLEAIKESFEAEGEETVCITDDQALVVDGATRKIV